MEEKNKKEINVLDFTKGSRIAKAFLLTAIGIIALFVLATLIFKVSINANKLKESFNLEVVKIIEEKAGNLQEKPIVNIEGEVKFHVFPTPNISVTNVVVSNLVNGEYIMNASIDRIRINLDTANIVRRKIVPKEIYVNESNFLIEKLNDNKEIYLIKDIFQDFDKHIKNKGIEITGRQTNIIISKTNYRREFDFVDVDFFYIKNKFTAEGHLSSNKQPLDINLDIDFSRKNKFNGKLHFSSLAFSFDTTFDGNKTENGTELTGKTDLDINNFQIFARTMSNSHSFFHRKIIDNKHFKTEFDFLLKDKIFSANDIVFNGANIDGNAVVEFNLNENQRNKIQINLKKLDLDNLLNNDISSNQPLDEKKIKIFNGDYKELISNKNFAVNNYIDKYIKFNPTDIQLKANNVVFNKNNIQEIDLDLSYNNDVKLNSISAKLPFETNFSIDQENKIKIEGTDFRRFTNFLRGLDNSQTTPNDKKFSLNGDFSITENKILVTNAEFLNEDIVSNNEIEIDFDSGINFIAIKSEIEHLHLDKYFTFIDTYTGNSNKPLRMQVLSLNNININTAINATVKQISYGTTTDENYGFSAFLSRGFLNVQNFSMNDKFGGSFTVDIRNEKPFLNVNFGGINTRITDKLNLEDILFRVPLLDQFQGYFNLIFENTDFKKSKINNLRLMSTIDNGTIKIDSFKVDGFGGNCSINGFVDVKQSRKLNLTFSECNMLLEDVLYLFTKNESNKVMGNLGIGAVMLSSGISRSDFHNNYSLRANIKGNNLIINNFGLTKLNLEMFKAHVDHKILQTVNPTEIINSKDEYTVFDNFNGTFGYANSKGIFDVDMSRPFINGKLKGDFTFARDQNGMDLNAFWTFNMLTGTTTTTTPIIIVYQLTGATNKDFKMAGNLNAVDNYLSEIREIYKNASE